MRPTLVRWVPRWFCRQWTVKSPRFSFLKENQPYPDPDTVKLDTIGPAFDRALARKKARQAEAFQATRRHLGSLDDFSSFLPPSLDNGPLGWTSKRGNYGKDEGPSWAPRRENL